MKIVLPSTGREIKIYFKKRHREANVYRHHQPHMVMLRDVIDTVCFLVVDDVSIPIEATAYLNPIDKYSKIIGKKLSLQRLLGFSLLDRLDRKAVWKVFVAEHITGKKK